MATCLLYLHLEVKMVLVKGGCSTMKIQCRKHCADSVNSCRSDVATGMQRDLLVSIVVGCSC